MIIFWFISFFSIWMNSKTNICYKSKISLRMQSAMLKNSNREFVFCQHLAKCIFSFLCDSKTIRTQSGLSLREWTHVRRAVFVNWGSWLWKISGIFLKHHHRALCIPLCSSACPLLAKSAPRRMESFILILEGISLPIDSMNWFLKNRYFAIFPPSFRFLKRTTAIC